MNMDLNCMFIFTQTVLPIQMPLRSIV